MQINQTFMNTHFITIPSLGTFTIGGLTGSDTQDFGGETDGTFDFESFVIGAFELLVFGTGDEIGTDFF